MKKHVFIINPVAGKKKGIELIPYIENNYSNPIIIKTNYQGHAKKLAADNIGKDTIIYSVGGDGTLNEVINGIIGSDTTIAVVPFGSGNDFIKSVTSLKDPVEILNSYKKLQTKKIDVGVFNDRYFINISSIGFDAEIVYNARLFKKIPLLSGELSYLFSIFRTIFKLKSHDINIKIDNNSNFTANILLMAIANSKYYGGGMKPTPNAVFDDGLLDICLVQKASRLKVLALLPKYIKGKHEKIKEVEFIRCKEINIESYNPFPVNIDGEVTLQKFIKASIISKGLNILIPKESI